MTTDPRSGPPTDSPRPDTELPGTERSLRHALEGSVRRLPPSVPPVAAVLRAGRNRQRRRRTAATAFVCAAVACVSLLVQRTTAPAEPAGTSTAQPQRSPSASLSASAAAVPQAEVGSGVLDGIPWSVRLVLLPPSVSSGRMACPRMTIGGVRVDAAGGPLADCENAPTDSALGRGGGVYVAHGSGLRLYLSLGADDDASAVITFQDGSSARAQSVTVPGTAVNALVVPIAPGRRIAVIDEYDSHGHRVQHLTGFR